MRINHQRQTSAPLYKLFLSIILVLKKQLKNESCFLSLNSHCHKCIYLCQYCPPLCHFSSSALMKAQRLSIMCNLNGHSLPTKRAVHECHREIRSISSLYVLQMLDDFYRQTGRSLHSLCHYRKL